MRQYSSGMVALLVLIVALVGPAGVVAGTASATAEDCSFPLTEVDATGTEVTIDSEPQRIVTLSPSAAQTMWEIGAREKVVGVSQYAAYLDGADERTNVSGTGQATVNTEQVVALEPDLVLAPDVIPEDVVEKLRESGLTVFKFDYAVSIENITTKTELMGRLVGECDGAAQTVERMNEEISTVEEAVEGQDSPRVLYVFFGYTAGEGTFVHEIITAAGGINVAAEANITGYQPISDEIVVEQNPEWILLNSDGPTVPNSEAYNSTTAVKQGQTVILDANYVSQAAPRIVNPVTKLAQAFYPDAYAQANATATPTPTATATETPSPSPDGTAESTPTGTTTSDGQPGFTTVFALVGVVLAGLLARRS